MVHPLNGIALSQTPTSQLQARFGLKIVLQIRDRMLVISLSQVGRPATAMRHSGDEPKILGEKENSPHQVNSSPSIRLIIGPLSLRREPRRLDQRRRAVVIGRQFRFGLRHQLDVAVLRPGDAVQRGQRLRGAGGSCVVMKN